MTSRQRHSVDMAEVVEGANLRTTFRPARARSQKDAGQGSSFAPFLTLVVFGVVAVVVAVRLPAQNRDALSRQSDTAARTVPPAERTGPAAAGSSQRPANFWQQQTPPSVPVIREKTVPADRPDDWPDGRWIPVPRKEYQSLTAGLRPRTSSPREVWIERAEYSAEFDPTTGQLRDGQLLFRFGGQTHSAGLVSLEPLDLLITQLRWSHAEAVWGTAPDGKTKLLLDSAQRQLLGRWQAPGRRVLDRTEFDLHLAPAVISTLILRVPDGYIVTCSPGVLIPPSAEAPTHSKALQRPDSSAKPGAVGKPPSKALGAKPKTNRSESSPGSKNGVAKGAPAKGEPRNKPPAKNPPVRKSPAKKPGPNPSPAVKPSPPETSAKKSAPKDAPAKEPKSKDLVSERSPKKDSPTEASPAKGASAKKNPVEGPSKGKPQAVKPAAEKSVRPPSPAKKPPAKVSAKAFKTPSSKVPSSKETKALSAQNSPAADSAATASKTKVTSGHRAVLRTWRIELGSQTACRVAIEKVEAPRRSPNALRTNDSFHDSSSRGGS